MKVYIDKSELVSVLGQATIFADAREQHMQDVLIEAKEDDGGQIRFSAGNSERRTHMVVCGNVEEPGVVSIPCANTLRLVKSFSGDAVEIQAKKGNTVHLSCGTSKFSVMSTGETYDFSINDESFPPDSEAMNAVTIKSVDIRRAFNRTSFCVSKDDARYGLNGLYMKYKPEQKSIICVGTDGHRLALTSFPCDEDFYVPPRSLVPRKVASIASKLVSGSESVEMAIHDGWLRFWVGDNFYAFLMIDGEFPDYTQVLPRGCDYDCAVNAAELKGLLGRVALVSRDNRRPAMFDFGRDQLTVKAASVEFGTVEDHIGYSEYLDDRGDGIKVGMNPSYILDVLKVVGSENVKMEFAGVLRPAVFKPDDIDDPSMFVVMPMRLD